MTADLRPKIPDPVDSPMAIARERVDKLKARIRDIQAQMPQAKADAVTGMRHGWQGLDNLKKRLRQTLDEYAGAKADLIRLCGTTGADPKWELLSKTWVVLSRLEESGVDIGEMGRDIVTDIEFHVPASKLKMAIEKADSGEAE